ncbi:MAG TPA: HD domain-containing protein [Acidimicrobiales bacterium]|nr:HD domain-containing protein [Acidimicrobiales bacterium]
MTGSPARTAVHLARRFFGSLSPAAPRADDEAWARSQLLHGEARLWSAMAPADRRHAAGVARRVAAALGSDATRPIVAAALLHDVGKIDAGLGTAGRVVATVAGLAGGIERAEEWAGRPGPVGRVGRYLRHPQIGADLLRQAGSDPLTVAWAAEHHRPAARWTLPPRVADALKSADDD